MSKSNLSASQQAEELYSGRSLWSFWTTAKNEKQWMEIVKRAGECGFLFLFHRGIKNLSICRGSEYDIARFFFDSGDSESVVMRLEKPILFCPSEENIDNHIAVKPEVYLHMIELEGRAIYEYKYRENRRRLDVWEMRGKSKKLHLNEIDRLSRFDGNYSELPFILNFKIISDNKHLKGSSDIRYINSYWHTRLQEAIDDLSALRAEHPESLFDLHCFGKDNEFVCSLKD